MPFQPLRNPLSRRNWLRQVTLATTGAMVLPSLLTGCTDHEIPGPFVPGPHVPSPGGVGDPATVELYVRAANNIKNMQDWYEELDRRNNKYLLHVYTTVKGGETPPADWKDILINVFVKIGITFLEAAAKEIPGLGSAIAIAAKEYEKWGSEKSQGGTVDAAFGEFTENLIDIYDKVDNRLRSLQDPMNNYANLKQAFKDGGSFEFKSKIYDFESLVNANFPASGSDAFVKLITPAEYSFRRSLWNALMIKAGRMKTYETTWSEYMYGVDPRKIIKDIYADNTDIPAAYFRAYYDNGWGRTHVMEYQFLFDEKKLSEAAAKELFRDNIRGNVINPDALFDRDYVFKQFHAEKQKFHPYCDVTTEHSSAYYDCSDYQFTGGIFNEI